MVGEREGNSQNYFDNLFRPGFFHILENTGFQKYFFLYFKNPSLLVDGENCISLDAGILGGV